MIIIDMKRGLISVIDIKPLISLDYMYYFEDCGKNGMRDDANPETVNV